YELKSIYYYFFFQAEDGIRDFHVTGVQTCALPIYIEKAIAELEEALKGDDKDAIEAKTEKLAEASGTLAQKLYAEQAEAGAAPGAEQADDAGKADEVVDAEFEEVKDDGRK